jgi:hypothetical protein
MLNTEDNARGAKHSNAASTGAPESGRFAIDNDLETWRWIANGIGQLLSIAILEIAESALEKKDAEDIQCAVDFCQYLNFQLLKRCN